nr:uncharacterized protein LOC122273630 [Parasteatoda tepidariorum]
MAAVDEAPDLAVLICQIVRDEIQHVNAQPFKVHPRELQTTEASIRNEMDRSIAALTTNRPPFITTGRPIARPPRRFTTYAAKPQNNVPWSEPQRKTDLWRTTDNRPVCFHCGRPGHVVRYCRERTTFNDYRSNNPRGYPSVLPTTHLPDEDPLVLPEDGHRYVV